MSGSFAWGRCLEKTFICSGLGKSPACCGIYYTAQTTCRGWWHTSCSDLMLSLSLRDAIKHLPELTFALFTGAAINSCNIGRSLRLKLKREKWIELFKEWCGFSNVVTAPWLWSIPYRPARPAICLACAEVSRVTFSPSNFSKLWNTILLMFLLFYKMNEILECS